MEPSPLSPNIEWGLNLNPPHPFKRQRIRHVFRTGIKAIDTFYSTRQRTTHGDFCGKRRGKSTLLGMMASQAEADVNVIALIGERGREVREFLEKDLDEKGRAKSVVVVATSNQPALARLKGAFLAMAIAEYFRDIGLNVMLMMDSVTRFAMAQREIGLAVGEPPTTRGYTPSVFSLLPQLLERAGMGGRNGVDYRFVYRACRGGDDMNDPIADSVRSILDGHIVLSRELATLNHYPAIDVLDSVSRLVRDLLTPQQIALSARGRESMAVYRKNQDLINIGAYVSGSSSVIDQAIRMQPTMNQFLKQNIHDGFAVDKSWALLGQVIDSSGTALPAATTPATKK